MPPWYMSGGLRTTLEKQLFPSTMWIWGPELRLSGLEDEPTPDPGKSILVVDIIYIKCAF